MKKSSDVIKKNLEKLTELQYKVTQEKATEAPFKNKYDNFFDKGSYLCIVCEEKLFDSSQKFNSGCGWPAFAKPASETVIKEEVDDTLMRTRTETLCSNCGAHLGHVFDDGPSSMGGLRYCINSASLKHVKE